MFGFVRPAACRSSAPRSVTDGRPYPPLPRRAKNRNKIQLFSHRKQEINGNDGNSFHRCKLLPPPTGRSPSLEEGGLGVRRSRPSPLPSIGYRGFAVAPMTLRAPSRNLVYNPGCRVETLLVSKGVMGFLGDLRGRNRNLPPNPLGLAERVLAAHFTYFIFNSARSVNVPAFFGREHPPRTQEI